MAGMTSVTGVGTGVTGVTAMASISKLACSGRCRSGRVFIRGLAVLILGGSIGDSSSGLPGSCARRSDPTASSLGSLGRRMVQLVKVHVILVLFIRSGALDRVNRKGRFALGSLS
jgi:hypothetical protein